MVLLCQLRLDDTLRANLEIPDLDDFEPCHGQDSVPGSYSPLFRRDDSHHQKIHGRAEMMRVLICDYNLVDQEFAVPGLHRGFDVAEDLKTLLIWPAVQHGMEVVCSST